jgi:hypothetical protein
MQTTTNQDPLFAGFEVISVYTRAMALADGALVDVSHMAKSAGFRVPVAITAAVWADCVAWDRLQDGPGQDESGRAWDILMLGNVAARACIRDARAPIHLSRVPRGLQDAALVELEMVIGPGDTPAPVITIQFPGED